ncbi:hypothetical protein EYF80_005931 [Liparis tanakae]|uniref:Uncharacterized protein n=1 Tax=Liparis tanakae TaxID=230148 RepID=A0A4Z2J0A1_9TELE|nr:hypothetical protein EYF80_005931 [Liparis tanakae]
MILAGGERYSILRQHIRKEHKRRDCKTRYLNSVGNINNQFEDDRVERVQIVGLCFDVRRKSRVVVDVRPGLQQLLLRGGDDLYPRSCNTSWSDRALIM